MKYGGRNINVNFTPREPEVEKQKGSYMVLIAMLILGLQFNEFDGT